MTKKYDLILNPDNQLTVEEWCRDLKKPQSFVLNLIFAEGLRSIRIKEVIAKQKKTKGKLEAVKKARARMKEIRAARAQEGVQ